MQLNFGENYKKKKKIHTNITLNTFSNLFSLTYWFGLCEETL